MRSWVVALLLVLVAGVVMADMEAVTERGATVILKDDGTWVYAGEDQPCWVRLRQLYDVVAVKVVAADTSGEERQHNWSITIHNKSDRTELFDMVIEWVDSAGCPLTCVRQFGLSVMADSTTTFTGGKMVSAGVAALFQRVRAQVDIRPHEIGKSPAEPGAGE